jgi:hypothetical protein
MRQEVKRRKTAANEADRARKEAESTLRQTRAELAEANSRMTGESRRVDQPPTSNLLMEFVTAQLKEQKEKMEQRVEQQMDRASNDRRNS